MSESDNTRVAHDIVLAVLRFFCAKTQDWPIQLESITNHNSFSNLCPIRQLATAEEEDEEEEKNAFCVESTRTHIFRWRKTCVPRVFSFVFVLNWIATMNACNDIDRHRWCVPFSVRSSEYNSFSISRLNYVWRAYFLFRWTAFDTFSI